MHGTIVAFQRNMYNAVQEINMGGAGNTDVMVLS
jgi:hypothetical protein